MTTHLDEPADLEVENPCRMTWPDIATTSMIGREPRPEPLRPEAGTSPAEALERVLEPVLAGGRCFVSFSGSGESSLVLAAATRAARRCGHRDPVPVTTRYVRARGGGRDVEAQEQLIAHLELRDWKRIVVDDELELAGPYARRALDSAGILFPSNAYLLLPQLDAAAGGTLVVAFGVMDFFMYWHWARLWEVLRLRRRPGRADLRLLGAAALPRAAASIDAGAAAAPPGHAVASSRRGRARGAPLPRRGHGGSASILGGDSSAAHASVPRRHPSRSRRARRGRTGTRADAAPRRALRRSGARRGTMVGYRGATTRARGVGRRSRSRRSSPPVRRTRPARRPVRRAHARVRSLVVGVP